MDSFMVRMFFMEQKGEARQPKSNTFYFILNAPPLRRQTRAPHKWAPRRVALLVDGRLAGEVDGGGIDEGCALRDATVRDEPGAVQHARRRDLRIEVHTKSSAMGGRAQQREEETLSKSKRGRRRDPWGEKGGKWG